MLKIIKDEERLKKYLVQLNIMDNGKYLHSNVFCCISEDNMEYIKDLCIESCFVEFFVDKNNEIAYCQYPECRDESVIHEKIYVLTKAGLIKNEVEK